MTRRADKRPSGVGAMALIVGVLSLASPLQGAAAQTAAAIGAVASSIESASVAGQVLVAARSIRSQSVITMADLAFASPGAANLGALVDPAAAIGMEARVTIYPGRPIRPGDLATPALVERNEIVRLSYNRGALTILAEGRALDRGGRGARVRVMNLDSRLTVIGRVAGRASVEVSR